MPKSYHAKVSFDLTGAPRREYRRVFEVVSDTLLKRPETAHALLFGSEKERRIDFVVDVESGSSSSARSQVDTWIRRMIYAIDPHSGVKTARRTPSALTQESVTRELIAG